MNRSMWSFTAAVSLSMLTSLICCGAGVANADTKWEYIDGIHESGDLVGSGTGQVTGGEPWVAREGRAKVNLQNGDVQFSVYGLVLAVGSNGSSTTGLAIGTPAGVTQVKGTLVCDLDGSAGGGNSVLVDTAPVALSAKGEAKFKGNVGTLPAVCSSEPDIAFLVRSVTSSSVANSNTDQWIAFGAARNP